jgi:zinc finger HIT domain-containing protein 1
MEDDVSNPFRRMSMRTRKIAPKMAAALASNDNRTQVSVFLLKRLRKKNVLQLFD